MGNAFDDFFLRLSSETGIASQSDLARELGLGRAAVSLAKKKGAVPARWVLALSRRHGLNPVWLESGRGASRIAPRVPGQSPAGRAAAATPPARALPPEPDLSWLPIPKVVARLCAGGGSFETGGQVEGHQAFDTAWLRRKGDPASMVLMGVVGNSMEPEIRDGDTVLIDQSKSDVLAGGIYAVGVEDTVLVKRIEKLPGRLVLRSDNPDYAPIELSGQDLDTVRVIGKVLWIGREYR